VLSNRHGANRTLAEVLSFDTKGVIETRAVILPGNRGGQLHKLCLIEFFTKASEQCVTYFHRCLSHGIGVFQHQTLDIGKIRVRAVVREVCNLFGRDPVFSADGRANINSKWTSDKGCDAKLCQPFEFVIHPLAPKL